MIKKHVIRMNVAVILICLAAFAVASGFLNGHFMTQAAERDMIRVTGMVVNQYEKTGDISGMSKGIDVRITVISLTGNVIYDSDAGGTVTENHLQREEVVAAIEGRPRMVKRRSATLNTDFAYYAEKAAYSGETVVVRIAAPAKNLTEYLTGSVAALSVLTALAAALLIVTARRTQNKLLKPLRLIQTSLKDINDGNFDRIPTEGYDPETASTLEEINEISLTIKETISEKSLESKKLRYVISGMGQGLIVAYRGGEIVLINDDAKDILDFRDEESTLANVPVVGEKLQAAVRNAIENRITGSFTFERGRNIYEISVSELNTEGRGGLAVALIRNVTEIQAAEKVRSEFFANASHELKTPLTSIKGFAELLSSGMVKDEGKKVQYSQRIASDSDRMLSLIDDMLKLSKLEEGGAASENVASVNLKTVASSVITGLTPQAAAKKIKLETELSDVIMSGDAEKFTELIQNLVDNSIKYSGEGGTVRVRVYETDSKKVIAVEDDGIGIAPKHQARIFERFYRVDKGRSRASGGTGLGLAIVKHIAAIYHGEITLKSQTGKGTDIRVSFDR